MSAQHGEEVKSEQEGIYYELERKINEYLDAKSIFISLPPTSSSPTTSFSSGSPHIKKKGSSFMHKRLKLFSAKGESDEKGISPTKSSSDSKYIDLSVNILPCLKLKRRFTTNFTGEDVN